MAKSKSKIVSFVQKNTNFGPGAVFFGVGGIPLDSSGNTCVLEDGTPNFPPVSSIIHCKHAYGSGAVVNRPCYVVNFENIGQVVVVPVEDATQITIQKIEEAEVPALPED